MVTVSGRGERCFWERCVFFAKASPAENASQVPVGPIAWESSPSIYRTSPKIPYHLSQNHIEPLPKVVLRYGPESCAGTICGCFCARRWPGWPCGNVSGAFLCPGVAQNTALRVFARFCVMPRTGSAGARGSWTCRPVSEVPGVPGAPPDAAGQESERHPPA